MSESKELELRLKEYEDMPGHILGLDGWLLQSLPQNQRATFLKGFEKLIRIVYFPDHAQTQQEKVQRERYIQAVSSAVSFLTSDPYAFELATETVPSNRSPVSKLKNSIGLFKGDISKLEQQLKKSNNANRALKRANEEFEKLVSFQRLRQYDADHRKNSRTFDIGFNKFLISGRAIDFQNKKKCESLRFSLRFINLNKLDDYDLVHERFSDEIEEDYLAGEEETFVFDKGVAKTNKGEVRILGGLPLESIREYVEFQFLDRNIDRNHLLAEDLKEHLATLVLEAPVNSKEKAKYEERVTPFLTSYFQLYSPVLLSRSCAEPDSEFKPQVKYNLFYVNGVNPHLR